VLVGTAFQRGFDCQTLPYRDWNCCGSTQASTVLRTSSAVGQMSRR
jgi:hypothetical protein